MKYSSVPRFARLVEMASDSILEGVFAIHKPYGMSSAQVIRDCKTYFDTSNVFKPLVDQGLEQQKRDGKQFGKRSRAKRENRFKFGHGGTLDPMATGVLILGVGKGTKSLNNFLNCTKSYETVVVFGASSDSYDRCGRLLKNRAYDHITREKVEKALNSFRGTFQQMPPIFSALKMEGKPLYEYAREGKPIPREIQTREVTVSDIEILEYYEPGTHKHYWPRTQATDAEKLYAEQLWRVEKAQAEGKKMSPEDEEADSKALAAHQASKRKLEERQDNLVVERASKKQRQNQYQKSPVLMSGALGELPELPAPPKGKGSDLAPPVDEDAPAPWDGKGPAAVRIRMTSTKGFYVRSFCHDLGLKLDSAGLMTELIRRRQGEFVLGGPNCLEFDDLAKGEEVWGPKITDILQRWNSPEGIKAQDKFVKVVGAENDIKMEKIESNSVEPKKKDVAVRSVEIKAEDVATASIEDKADDSEGLWNGFPDSPVPVKAEIAQKAS